MNINLWVEQETVLPPILGKDLDINNYLLSCNKQNFVAPNLKGGNLMYGYQGKILRINLSTGVCGVEALDETIAKKFVGGRGLGTKLYTDEVSPSVDALSPENKILFVTGPLTGTPTPTGGRYMVVTKSPLTGTIASSNSGGYWGPELKFAGYDLIIVEGKSDRPVYLMIEDEKLK